MPKPSADKTTGQTTDKTAGTPQPRMGRGRTPAAPALQEARDSLYRRHILTLAEPLFAQQGFADTRMQDIAAAAGISLSKLYNSYPSKDALYAALLTERNREFMAWIVAGMPGAITSIEQVLLLVERTLNYLMSHEHFLRLQLREGRQWSHPSAQITTAEQHAWTSSLRYIERLVEWGIKRQLFSVATPRSQAYLVIALQQVHLDNWVREGMRDRTAQIITRVQCDLLRLLCRPDTLLQFLAPEGNRLNAETEQALRRAEAAAATGTSTPQRPEASQSASNKKSSH